jgi:hypothetical protein
MEVDLSPTLLSVDLGEGSKTMSVTSKFKLALAA